MNMQQCPNGHFYDMSKSAQCPYCSGTAEGSNRTVPLDGGFDRQAQAQPMSYTTVPGNVWDAMNGSTVGRTVAVGTPMDDNRHTVAVIHKQIGLDPVVGWLVCVEGKERGRDYRVRSGNNSIGRSDTMDICIVGDDSISKIDMAYITYDAETRSYYIVAGKGKNVVRVNGELLPVSQSRCLAAHDRIKLGETILMFVPLCGEEFDWV